MAIDKDIYSIHAVRLVNFHNINHVVIPLREGGHLFLLGDNGSGKTTVLDAIHYVLSAGEQVELNSAARLGGNKLDGRRINGVVTRVNVDTGPLAPEGRVTYAALELRNGSGAPISIGIGLSIAGVNAPLQQWGFRIDSPVADLPLLLRDDEGNEYPPNREELKKILQRGNGRYYSGMSGFSQALARDFFPGRAQYDEYRKFLSMCKAYREISSRAGNYHELFKSLLPEPEREILQELRLSLRDLRESSSTLTALEKKCTYLGDLNGEKLLVDRLRGEIEMVELGRLWFALELQRGRLARAEEEVAARKAELARQVEKEEEAGRRLGEMDAALADLTASDGSQLIETEKIRSRELDSCRERLAICVEKGRRHAAEKADEEEALGKLSAAIRTTLGDLSGKLAENLSAWRELPLQPALERLEGLQLHDGPETGAGADEELSALVRAFAGAEERLRARLEEASGILSAARLERDQAEEKKKELESRTEVYPESLAGYAEILAELERRLLPVVPLYEKLHWKPSVSPAVRRAVEELIGEEALAALVVQPEDAQQVEAFLREKSPGGFRVIALDPEAKPLPPTWAYDFLGCYFDEEKDPSYLSLLAREFDSVTSLRFEDPESSPLYRWKGSLRVLRGRPARLIGEEERLAEHRRLLGLAEKELREREARWEDAKRQRAALEKRFNSLQRFQKRFEELYGRLEKLRAERERSRDRIELLETRAEENDRQTGEARQRIDELDRLLEDLRGQIRRRDLQSLHERIALLVEERKKLASQCQAIHDDRIRAQEKHDREEERGRLLGEEADKAASDFGKAQEIFTREHPANSWRKHLDEEEIRDKVACDERIGALKSKVSEARGRIRTKVNLSDGVDYGFVYDDESNELFSREHRSIGEILEKLSKDVAEQRKILNEEARRNFEHILLEQFRGSLRMRVHSLERMHRSINRMLQGHRFGNNTYRLKIEPLPDYAALVRVIRGYSDQTPESAEELREIFDLHTNDILETPANRIPEILDYRNYYRYEMLLQTAAAGERVMDTRTKSVGSGGEQAVPNYLLVMMIAHLLFDKLEGTSSRIKINTLLFDEAFYGIDQQRQDQLLSFAEELGLQLVIASPNQDGFKPELSNSTNVFVRKDKNYEVHLFCYNWHSEKTLLADEGELAPGTELT